ncbi:MAG: copper transporter, partial [Candidatus Rokubacteria bacterium]|nr:copper transporter [Candidatus Rokubacteria bacterium]
MSGYRLLVTLHLLGAAVWVGGHLVLSLSVLPRALRTRDPAIIRDFESAFERVGLPALLVQVLTGLWLALHWVPA